MFSYVTSIGVHMGMDDIQERPKGGDDEGKQVALFFHRTLNQPWSTKVYFANALFSKPTDLLDLPLGLPYSRPFHSYFPCTRLCLLKEKGRKKDVFAWQWWITREWRPRLSILVKHKRLKTSNGQNVSNENVVYMKVIWVIRWNKI